MSERDKRIIERIKAGENAVDIAAELGITAARIRQIRKAARIVPLRKQPFWVRFESRIHKTGECWIWTGATDQHGYGQVRINGKTFRCTRLALEYYKHIDPSGMDVLHNCDTPGCVNPDHLRVGTAAENSLDMLIRGRHTSSKMTPELVRSIRLRVEAGENYAQIARNLGYNHSTIERAAKGKTWAHV